MMTQTARLPWHPIHTTQSKYSSINDNSSLSMKNSLNRPVERLWNLWSFLYLDSGKKQCTFL
ncbi:MAG: hypothetical protein J2P37_20980, partial [Ktedonobacteraceae bacterium]|nr:hypothetical protein [Ktedonobacteraceae bacterium]